MKKTPTDFRLRPVPSSDEGPAVLASGSWAFASDEALAQNYPRYPGRQQLPSCIPLSCNYLNCMPLNRPCGCESFVVPCFCTTLKSAERDDERRTYSRPPLLACASDGNNDRSQLAPATRHVTSICQCESLCRCNEVCTCNYVYR